MSFVKWHSLYGDYMAFWCYSDWTFDGHTRAPGEVQDYFMCRHYSKWMRQKRGSLTAVVV